MLGGEDKIILINLRLETRTTLVPEQYACGGGREEGDYILYIHIEITCMAT
jgi:hypothetical protein